MITMIHGEDIAASRDYYWNLKQKMPDSVTLNGATISLTDLQQAVAGQDLFGTKKTVVIEDLFSKKKSPKDLEQFTDILNNSDADIILWESKELTPKQVGLLKEKIIKLFKIPATIFALLDSIKPGGGKILIEQFHKTLEEKDPEFVLFMLTRLIRTLLAMQDNSSPTISEVSRLAPWQRGKLDKQAKLFRVDQLLSLHEQLFNLERNMKTGGLTLSLADSMDFLLLSV